MMSQEWKKRMFVASLMFLHQEFEVEYLDQN